MTTFPAGRSGVEVMPSRPVSPRSAATETYPSAGFMSETSTTRLRKPDLPRRKRLPNHIDRRSPTPAEIITIRKGPSTTDTGSSPVGT
ncbi:unknown [Alistipes sp. CAG:157]|nr:unknown [Alistipes sp. CAG:157]